MIYNKPYIDMDPYVDTETFLNCTEEICKGLSKSEMFYASSGSRTYGLEDFPEIQMPYESEIKYKELTKGMDVNEKRLFLKFYKKVFYGTKGVFIKQHDNYNFKHLSSHSKYTENSKYFPQFIKYIESLPFEEIGRVFIFVQEHFMPLAEHRDSMNDDYTDELTDFLWFTFDKNEMRFWIRDEDNKKHYVESTCAWFNENDRHGSDGVPNATICIRVDGVFKPDFKEKVLQNG